MSSLKITVSALAALAALVCLRSVYFASSEHSSLGVGVAVRQAAAVSSPRCAQMPARGRFNAALRGLGKQQQQSSSISHYHNHHQKSAARWVSSWASARDVRVNAEIAPAIIIGGGRVGQALKEMGSGGDVILGRNDPFPENAPAGPIFVATRNDALDGVIEKVPASRREDLVFMQNGYLQEYLNKKGLPDATQVLVYFAVAKLGESPTDGVTDMNPEGLTAANGKWAQAAADRFHNAGLSCKVLDKTQFERAMFEKLIWISSFMLVGARHPGATVGDVESKHTKEVSDLIEELAKAVPGVDFAPQVSERLCAYARSVAHFPTAVKEFEWRNGFFNKLSIDSYMSGNKVDPCPIHSAYLAEIGQGTVVPFPFEGYDEHVTEEELNTQDEILSKFEVIKEKERLRKIKEREMAAERRRREIKKRDSAKKKKEAKEEQSTKARQLDMAKTAAEEETKRSRRRSG